MTISRRHFLHGGAVASAALTTIPAQASPLSITTMSSPPLLFATRTDAATATIDPSSTWLDLMGYHAPGDGGGVFYQRVATQPAHAGAFQSADQVAAGTGWWEIIPLNELTPEMFGARRDGTTDDSAAINAALSFGRPVKLTSGTYRITNTVSLPVTGTVLAGPPTAVIAFAPILPIAIRIRASQCELRGFKLMSDTAPTQLIAAIKYGIYVGETLYDGPPDSQKPGTNTISARDVVMDLVIADLEISGIHGAGIRLNYVDRSRVVGNLVRHCGTHGIMISLGSHNEISGNTVEYIGPGSAPTQEEVDKGTVKPPYHPAYGITVTRDPARSPYATATGTAIGTGFSTGNRIIGNTVRSVRSWNGIDSHGARDLMIANNTVQDCYLGIHLEDGDWQTDSGGVPHPGHYIQILDNSITAPSGTSTIVLSGTTYTYGIGAAINLDGGSNNNMVRQIQLQVVGNRIYGAGYHTNGFTAHIGAGAGATGAIRVQHVEACQIVGNTFEQCRRFAVWLGPECRGVAVTGNAFHNVIAVTSQPSDVYNGYRYGVWLAASTASCVLDGNIFYGASGMVGYGSMSVSYTGDYGYTVGTNKKFGAMTLV